MHWASKTSHSTMCWSLVCCL